MKIYYDLKYMNGWLLLATASYHSFITKKSKLNE